MTADAPTFIQNSSGAGPFAASVLDIIFVHGLSGDRFKTWYETEECFWLKWLADEFPNCNVYSAGYDTDVFYNRLTGPGASFQDLATMLADGIASRTHPASRIMLVTHSLGGLIVKQMVRKCSDSVDPAFTKIARSVNGVVFFGTPHQGSGLSTAIDTILSKFKSKAVKQMAYGEDALIDLHEFFRNWATSHSVFVKAYYETQKTWGVQVVDKISANPHVYGAEPIAVQADHIEICKPKSKDALVYKSMASLIAQMIEAPLVNQHAVPTGTALVLVPSAISVPTSAGSSQLTPIAPSCSLGPQVPTTPALSASTQSLGPALPEGLAPDILIDYEFYTTTADADRRDLAVKLAASGRSYQVRDAERKKERFSMALRRHIAQPAALTRYTKLMADVETRFHRHIDRLTASGADTGTIDNQIQTTVIDPCTANHSTAGQDISASLVDSAVYYLAGNCHIRWDNDPH